jgi:hypothetical protein
MSWTYRGSGVTGGILEGKNDSARMAYKIADGGVFQFMTTNHSQEKDETVGFAKK